MTVEGCIYIIVNLANGRVYIGKTIKHFLQRWKEHCKHAVKRDSVLARAISKYGEERFGKAVLEFVSAKLLNERERFWIQYFGSRKLGYNQTNGGDGFQGGKHSETAKRKISVGQKNRPFPTKETRALYSRLCKMRVWTEEAREKVSRASKGRKHSASSRKLIAKASQAYWSKARSRNKASANMRRRHAEGQLASNPEIALKIGAKVRKRWNEPGYRARLQFALKNGAAKHWGPQRKKYLEILKFVGKQPLKVTEIQRISGEGYGQIYRALQYLKREGKVIRSGVQYHV